MRHHPSRIVCLSAEAVEIIYALGAGDRIVGVTGFAYDRNLPSAANPASAASPASITTRWTH